MKTVKKAIIPAAGLGTRFLPATKAMPKEMLPIVDKPTIQYIVEEAIASGIEDIIIVTGKGKRAIEDHFDNSFELEDSLIKKEKFDLLDKVRESSNVDIHYIRQKEPRGLGHAVWSARKFIGNEAFAVLLGDDIVRSQVPCLKQLINQYDEKQSSIIGVQTVPDNETHRYGIIKPNTNEGRLFKVDQLVEKPPIGEAPSNLAIMGRYVLTPEIFELLGTQENGAGNEVQLTDAIERLNKLQPVYAYDFEGRRFDVGEKLGFIQTTIEMALERGDLKEDLYLFMEKLLKNKSVVK
ncbi:UTP--glucose-1-phosphate uridylyltransferase GalU [Aquibacillus koreensis]|uniref:UTP--glucose-1-phosphate uridylyltransferase n=1 Tax=Aquibacillus koreensis TaxID=279446 RepID=A0A9X3WM57_9BACI|nr:UTP--glucose-1-phosphate uridylyltransferase GalU [Aquibacillus koreensis]MCT2535292.1 UTP--glucose-1-phosphate uridylyltransferase GalU [Aquibacillus koreensis]MDC3419776.1 UTP--glucose-1-phosphate uridylyltransferase GalU [Aquibacillus koreensis]